ncbi:CRK [Mytilus edulis]|uniref:CRK n=1 Tax=Mytilus edulis TaxID=6550 RepID=A0A8S3T0I1_MYTED|nr:CRK [Mytilus edulis]
MIAATHEKSLLKHAVVVVLKDQYNQWFVAKVKLKERNGRDVQNPDNHHETKIEGISYKKGHLPNTPLKQGDVVVNTMSMKVKLVSSNQRLVVLSHSLWSPVVLSHSPMSPVVLSHHPMSPVVLSHSPKSPVVLSHSPKSPVVLSHRPMSPVVLSHSPMSPVVLSHSPRSPAVLSHSPQLPVVSVFSVKKTIHVTYRTNLKYSKAFQQGTINFPSVQPAIGHIMDSLDDLLPTDSDNPLTSNGRTKLPQSFIHLFVYEHVMTPILALIHEEDGVINNWYFGPLNREETNEILIPEKEPGVFLVRESQSIRGDFCIMCKGRK